MGRANVAYKSDQIVTDHSRNINIVEKSMIAPSLIGKTTTTKVNEALEEAISKVNGTRVNTNRVIKVNKKICTKLEVSCCD